MHDAVVRSYTLTRMPSVIELTESEVLAASREVESVVGRRLDAPVVVAVAGACLVLPAPHEIRRDGRALPGEEWEDYAQACLTACAGLPIRALRYAVEEIYVPCRAARASSPRGRRTPRQRTRRDGREREAGDMKLRCPSTRSDDRARGRPGFRRYERADVRAHWDRRGLPLGHTRAPTALRVPQRPVPRRPLTPWRRARECAPDPSRAR